MGLFAFSAVRLKKKLSACVGKEGIEFLLSLRWLKKNKTTNLISLISSVKEAMTASTNTGYHLCRRYSVVRAVLITGEMKSKEVYG